MSLQCDGPPWNAMPVIKDNPMIPQDINVGMIGGTNVSNPAMTTCCFPNKVQLLDGCYLWCQIPGKGAKDDKNTEPKLESDEIFQNFTSCLRVSGLNTTENRGIGGNIVNGGLRISPVLSTAGLGLWALALLAFLA